MKIAPRIYQSKAVGVTWALLERGRWVLLTSPGGSGKSVMIAMLCRRELRRGGAVLVLAPRREIVDQILSQLHDLGIPDCHVGTIMAGVDKSLVRPRARIQVASKDTISVRHLRPDASLVIVDECHHAPAAGYQALLRRYRRARHVGLTATPMRLDNKPLGEFYDDLVVAALPSELIKAGYLANPRVFTTDDQFLPNLEHVRVRMGDYVTTDLEKVVDTAVLMGNVMDHWASRARDRRTVGFGATIEHSKHLTARAVGLGIVAEHLDGSFPLEERKKVLSRLARGRTRIVFTCMVLSEGWDFPGCGALILGRPTRSETIYLQQANRVMRSNGGPRPIILDHTRGWEAFGYPHADRTFSLDRGHDDGDEAGSAGQLRKCPHCAAVVGRQESDCPECGKTMPPLPVIQRTAIPSEVDALLLEMTREKAKEIEERVRKYAADHGCGPEWIKAVMRRWCELNEVA